MPTQIVSNGEFNPLPQTREQQRVEARIKELSEDLSPRHGMNRRQFLASSAGMAAAFLAMNEVFGSVFDVSLAEAQQPGVAAARSGALAGQFIVDVQTHFVRDDFNQAGLLDLAKYAKQNWNPNIAGENDLARTIRDYVKEVFVDSERMWPPVARRSTIRRDLLSTTDRCRPRLVNRIADSDGCSATPCSQPRIAAGWTVDRPSPCEPTAEGLHYRDRCSVEAELVRRLDTRGVSVLQKAVRPGSTLPSQCLRLSTTSSPCRTLSVLDRRDLARVQPS